MKTLIAIAVSLILFTAAKSVAQEIPDEILPNDSALYELKAEKEFVGARVEIYASSGALVTSQDLYHRKMIIDFGPVAKDTYTIRVVKGEAVQEFQYERK